MKMKLFEATKVEKYYIEKLEKEGGMLFSLIDPDKIFLEKAVKIAKASEEGGADAILVGGSIGAQGEVLDKTVKMIKESVKIPVVLFPGNISGLSNYADAVYFMSMLNSRDAYWMSTAQIQAAPAVKLYNIEAIPTTYVIVEPGRTVGWIGNANMVPRERADLGAACALAAKYMGSRVLILESGSGAPEPAPEEMIKAIDKAVGNTMFKFIAGGVRTPEQAAKCISAGADGIQVGTAFEAEDVKKKVKEMAKAIKEAGRKRV